MRRLKTTEVRGYREELLREQGGKCALCGEAITGNEAVLDHCHTTGRIRGVLHRGCNAGLGHIENNAPRYRLTDIRRLTKWLRAIPAYIHGQYEDHPFHPTYRTEEEKRLRRNTLARKRRERKKNDES